MPSFILSCSYVLFLPFISIYTIMDTVSLYDKYHSEHNKKYMYNLITNLLQKEYSVDMSSNSMYNQFFETNFMNTFKDLQSRVNKAINAKLESAST